MKHKTGIILLLIGGICMVIGQAVGTVGVFEFLHDYVVASVPTEWVSLADDVMRLIQFIADSGGWAIIAGAIFILIGLMRLGKFIIWIGLTFGLIALIVWVVVQFVNFFGISLGSTVDPLLNQIYGLFTYNTGISFIGVALAVIGRASVKKVKEPKFEFPEETEDGAPEAEVTKTCPKCGVQLPLYANFCSKCGETFD